jgi:hypothetical protein
VSPEHLNRLYSFFFEFVYFAERALHGRDNESAILALFKAFEGASDTAKARLNDDSDRLPEVICELGVLELLQNMDYDWSKLSDPSAKPRTLIRRALLNFQGAPQQQAGVVDYLLGRGADPNQLRMQRSPFQEYLAMLLSNKSTEEQEGDSFRVVAALVAHGADISAIIGPAGAPKLSAREAISRLFPPELASRILASAPTGKGPQPQPPTTGRRMPVSPKLEGVNASSTPSPGCGAMLWSRLGRIFARQNG